ncbi:MAG: hypothetical protein A3F18_06180 [Legionellales bacterium RIFCSPHIGHO2_12_FULL_37_14]|nr:MAG: hypothetical protein A3F18_06180 [Legionellales bacterium RIFCSPHIGHO2_12_FULL_37_14]
MNWFILYALLFFLSFILTTLVRKYALRRDYCIDIPNDRSSHVTPTPRGGGLAFVLSFLLGIVICFRFAVLSYELFFALVVIGVGLAALGFVDDNLNLSAKFKFGMQFLLSIISLCLLGFFQPTMLPWQISFAVIFYMLWMINLYNFMDGIDGYVVMQTMFVTATLAIFYPSISIVALCLFFATFGFGLWNFPKAKIFMGDVGSVFLGGILSILSIYLLMYANNVIVPWFILMALFLADASITLLKRIYNKERFWEAHRQHAYQCLTRRFNSHVMVTLLGLGINICYLLPLAYLTIQGSFSPMLGFLLAYVPLATAILWCKSKDF